MEWIHDEYSMVGKHRLCADASAGEKLVLIGNVENWSRS